MLTKQAIVNLILKDQKSNPLEEAFAFAPSNIALAKYWGKRNQILNLPMNSSLSISLADKGANAQIKLSEKAHQIIINKKILDCESPHTKRLNEYLSLFNHYYQLELSVNIPLAAGLASSAAIFASIIQALNKLHQWQLSTRERSILARLGSGSACRSIETGFVEWNMGVEIDGMDSIARALSNKWPDLCVGLLVFDDKVKPISSTKGMQLTVETSPLYKAWPKAANKAVSSLKNAIADQDFNLLGQVAENNARAMHATMLSADPALIYSNETTLKTIKQLLQLRHQGLDVYFTQDAGPNLKLLFLHKDSNNIKQHFKDVEIIQPFNQG